MAGRRNYKRSKHFWVRHRYLKRILILVVVIIAVIIGVFLFLKAQTAYRQHKLQPFYDTAGLPTTGPLGQVIRQEPLGVSVKGGSAWRILYRTQRADGSNGFSSGLVFVPSDPATAPRPVVAWAHGTLGMGDQCAPSRTANPVASIAWVSGLLQKGWVVVATDYAGFGTAGTQGYLVGDDEAHDVLNSVRAARLLSQTKAGSDFVVWGHSQGGNSALFSQQAAASYAPELHLVATVASAPAAELVPLLTEQYNTAADWIIGPLIATAWPAAKVSLNIHDILTSTGLSNYQSIANQCIIPATIEGLIRNTLGQRFFTTNPINVASWRAMATQQSAPLPAAGQPLMVVESLSDQVVLPNTTALYIHQACQADPNVTTLWLNGVAHQQIPAKSAEAVISWISDRFASKATTPSCNQILPVQPAATS